jgi:hypothetical protein
MTDYTKLLAKIVPKADGEDVVRWRTGIVDAVNSNGTLDVAISGLVVPSLPAIAGGGARVGDTVHIVSYRGALIVLGKVSRSGLAITSITQAKSSALTACTAAGNNIPGTTINVTTLHDNAAYLALYVGDFTLETTGDATGVVMPVLDGTPISSSSEALADFSNLAVSGRVTAGNMNFGTISAAGAHTFLLRATRVGGADDDIIVRAQHTQLTLMMFD